MNTNEQQAEVENKLAQAAYKRADDSFERCDTDGFLSQWASTLTGNLHSTKRDILKRGGKALFLGLWEGERRVKAKLIETRYGQCWILHQEEVQKFGRTFIPCGRNSKIQKNLGLHEAREWDDADAIIDSVGRGLSGRAWVATIRANPNTWGQRSVQATKEELAEAGWEG